MDCRRPDLLHFRSILTKRIVCGADASVDRDATIDPEHVTCDACLQWLGRSAGRARCGTGASGG